MKNFDFNHSTGLTNKLTILSDIRQSKANSLGLFNYFDRNISTVVIALWISQSQNLSKVCTFVYFLTFSVSTACATEIEKTQTRTDAELELMFS